MKEGRGGMTIDDEAARHLFDTYSKYVFQTAFFLSGDRSLAEDITQESFLKAFLRYKSYKQDRPIKPWLYRIVVNTSRNYLKHKKKHRYYNIAEVDPDVISSDLDIVAVVVQNEYKATLLKAFDHLTQKSKEVVVLRYFEDMSLVEIAQALSIPVGTCKSRLNSAIHQLRTHLPADVSSEYEGGGTLERS